MIGQEQTVQIDASHLRILNLLHLRCLFLGMCRLPSWCRSFRSLYGHMPRSFKQSTVHQTQVVNVIIAFRARPRPLWKWEQLEAKVGLLLFRQGERGVLREGAYRGVQPIKGVLNTWNSKHLKHVLLRIILSLRTLGLHGAVILHTPESRPMIHKHGLKEVDKHVLFELMCT